MAQKAPVFHGWLNIDKPLSMTSHQVVAVIRRIFSQKKVGHAGTLDPLATGVLPIALGEATKTVPYMVDAGKVYTFTVKWGESTTTDDREGEVVARSDHRPSKDEILAALGEFEGEITQVPPLYSAIKIGGQRAYALARKNQEVEMPSRLVQIHQFSLEEVLSRDEASFRVACGKGTYVRSLGRDLALRLGTVGHVSRLNRVQVGSFSQGDAISLDSLRNIGHKNDLKGYLLPLDAVLDDIPGVTLDEEEAGRLRRGLTLSMVERDVPDGMVVCFDANKCPMAMAFVEAGVLAPKRVFQYHSERSPDVDYS